MRLDIMYACDEYYVIQAGVSIVSLLKNKKESEDIHIHFVEDHISQSSKIQLHSLVTSLHGTLIFYKLQDVCNVALLIQKERYPCTIYAKLFMSFLQVDKLLYLDCDTIVHSSLSDLWSMDMEQYDIAAVCMPYNHNKKGAVGLSEEHPYICDGIVLIHLRRWREKHLEETCRDVIRQYSGVPPMLSEGVINYVCAGNIKVLHPSYNVMPFMFLLNEEKISALFHIAAYYSNEELQAATERPLIVHYIKELYNRPWCKPCDHPMRSYYEYYLNHSPWKGTPPKREALNIKTRLLKWSLQHLPIALVVGVRTVFHFIKNKRSS